jgi:hypothetical protein
VLVAQLQGTSIHLTNKAGAMASRSPNDDSIAAEDDHMVKQQSETDREQNKDRLTIAAASQNQRFSSEHECYKIINSFYFFFK